MIQRFLALKWWRFDLSEYTSEFDYSDVSRALERLEALKLEGKLRLLDPATYRLAPSTEPIRLSSALVPG